MSWCISLFTIIIIIISSNKQHKAYSSYFPHSSSRNATRAYFHNQCTVFFLFVYIYFFLLANQSMWSWHITPYCTTRKITLHMYVVMATIEKIFLFWKNDSILPDRLQFLLMPHDDDCDFCHYRSYVEHEREWPFWFFVPFLYHNFSPIYLAPFVVVCGDIAWVHCG